MSANPDARAVLVTGAGGFIGRHLTAALAADGFSVRALDLHPEALGDLAAHDGVEVLGGDAADPAVLRPAVDGVDTVYHLAAAHLGAGIDEAEFRRVNVEGVRHLVDAVLANDACRLVHCSSVGVYGRIENPPADESTACAPDLAYERTKLEGEGVVLDAVRDRGLDAVIVRPVWVYGPGCPRTEKLFRSIRKGRFVVAGKGDGLRHCVFIDDMVAAFRLAASTSDVAGEVFIIGDDAAVSIRELVDTIARVGGGSPPRSVPYGLLNLAAIAAETAFLPLGKEPPISRRTLKFFTNNTAFRIDRARERLGYRPAFDLESGLRETWRRITS